MGLPSNTRDAVDRFSLCASTGILTHDDVQRGYNASARAWNLPSDPLTYVVDAEGVIRTKLEGAFSPGELDAAVRAVAPTR